MNAEKVITAVFGGVVSIAILTTIFGRRTTPRVFDSLGRAGSSLISAGLGRGVRGLN